MSYYLDFVVPSFGFNVRCCFDLGQSSAVRGFTDRLDISCNLRVRRGPWVGLEMSFGPSPLERELYHHRVTDPFDRFILS